MNKGQATQRDDSGFFTTGAGTNDENVNTFESENNLDTEEWGITPEKNPKSIGVRVMKANPESVVTQPGAEQIEMSMPPTSEQIPVASAESLSAQASIPAPGPVQLPAPAQSTSEALDVQINDNDPNDKIDNNGVEAVKAAIDGFLKGDDIDPASLYETYQDITEKHKEGAF